MKRAEEGVTRFGNLDSRTEEEEDVICSFGSIDSEGFPVSAVSDGDKLEGRLEAMYSVKEGSEYNDDERSDSRTLSAIPVHFRRCRPNLQ